MELIVVIQETDNGVKDHGIKSSGQKSWILGILLRLIQHESLKNLNVGYD